MRLPESWESFLSPYIPFSLFYDQLDAFVDEFPQVIPRRGHIFHVFHRISPENVRVVLLGEDPYPRLTSANGIAFWDMEIRRWQDKTRGSSLKNILKALLTARGLADYNTPLEQCRQIVRSHNFPEPPALFEYWLGRGIFLLNTALTYSAERDKKKHFAFWHSFNSWVITALNQRSPDTPCYILWGGKAARWQPAIQQSSNGAQNIIRQGHPTFIHQFMDKNNPAYSPFTEIEQKTGLNWLPKPSDKGNSPTLF